MNRIHFPSTTEARLNVWAVHAKYDTVDLAWEERMSCRSSSLIAHNPRLGAFTLHMVKQGMYPSGTVVGQDSLLLHHLPHV